MVIFLWFYNIYQRSYVFVNTEQRQSTFFKLDSKVCLEYNWFCSERLNIQYCSVYDWKLILSQHGFNSCMHFFFYSTSAEVSVSCRSSLFFAIPFSKSAISTLEYLKRKVLLPWSLLRSLFLRLSVPQRALLLFCRRPWTEIFHQKCCWWGWV